MLPSGAPLSDWLAWLETLSPNEIDLGLERMHLMLARLAPSKPEHVLLIAGTNGKGSSVAMGSALLRASGKRVGAYTSPHLHRYNERIVVDGEEASDAEIVAAFEEIESHRDGLPLTYFEYGTLAALLVFAAAQLDAWILEVGLGGRLDASNAIEPSASLITNISLDHCDWLGSDVETIAKEKAGVMRAGVVTVFGGLSVPSAITRHATDSDARLLSRGEHFDVSFNADGSWNWRGPEHSFEGLHRPALQGEFQVDNAAAVLMLLRATGLDVELNAEHVSAALASVVLAGRSQPLQADSRHWLFDVAHNPASAAALAQTLASSRARGRTWAIVGILNDKDVDGLVAPLCEHVDHWIAVNAESARAVAATELARRIANSCDRPCAVSQTLPEALDYSRQTAAENDRIVVTGSFHTVGPALRYLKTTLANRKTTQR